MNRKFLGFILCLFSLIIGVLGGAVGITYATLPDTEELIVGEETFYTYNSTSSVKSTEYTGQAGELSVHFLELGNKYTGDCTYIKYGETDILIDCGSKSSSISTVENYLRTYMGENDNKIDYCIVTHAHTDHYAGFATGTKTKSIFDLFTFGTIIDFGAGTNKSLTSPTGMMKNYLTNRNEATKDAYFDASTITKGNNKVYSIGTSGEVKLEILYNEYNMANESSSENNYSVCALLTYNNKEFLFTGDLEEHGSNGETKLLANNQSLLDIQASGDGVELYKAGHHGSKTSSSSEFMEAMKPEIVCVCCCAGSEEYTDTINNQFPTQEFIDVVSRYTDNIYVTTLCVDWENDEFTSMNGNIVIIAIPGEELGVDGSNNETILRETEWFNRTITENNVERPMRTWPSYGVVDG